MRMAGGGEGEWEGEGAGEGGGDPRTPRLLSRAADESDAITWCSVSAGACYVVCERAVLRDGEGQETPEPCHRALTSG